MDLRITMLLWKPHLETTYAQSAKEPDHTKQRRARTLRNLHLLANQIISLLGSSHAAPLFRERTLSASLEQRSPAVSSMYPEMELEKQRLQRVSGFLSQ